MGEIKFLTLEKEEISIGYDDAKYIAFESGLVGSVLSNEIELVEEPRFGGKAIKFALEYCTKFGKIKYGFSPWSDNPSAGYCYVMSSPEFEMKCKEADVKDWVDGFIGQIENDLGMVHELLAVSEYLSAFRLSDLLCQYMFDYLTFKPYGKFREIFGISFVFSPYGSRSNIHDMFEGILELPTLEDICEKINTEFPFTPDELTKAELENKSVRVGENLEYNNEKGLIKFFFIKVECLVRRLNSLRILYEWMQTAMSDLIKYLSEPNSLCRKEFGNMLNNGIDEIYSILWTERFWRFPEEADYFRKLDKKNHKYATRQNINQHAEVKNECRSRNKHECILTCC